MSMRGPTTVSWKDGLIVDVSDATSTERRDAELIAPGFVDLQVNGIGRERVADLRCDVASIAERLRSQGVTSWLPTVPTQDPTYYTHDTVDALRRHIELPKDMPQAMGIHFEGPLLGARPGAHREDFFDVDESILDVLEMGRMVTIAPEHALANAAMLRLCPQGIVVSLGHTAASPEDIRHFVRNGGRCATHLFNAMTGIDHVSGGVALDVLGETRLVFSMIADLRHVSAQVLRLAWRLGGERMFLVSDQVSSDDVSLRSPSARLRGAATGVDDGLRNLVNACDVPLHHALAMVTRVPANLLGDNQRGRLGRGRRADIVLLDADLGVHGVVCNGFPTSR